MTKTLINTLGTRFYHKDYKEFIKYNGEIPINKTFIFVCFSEFQNDNKIVSNYAKEANQFTNEIYLFAQNKYQSKYLNNWAPKKVIFNKNDLLTIFN